MEEILKQILEGQKRMEQRFDGVDQRLDGIDKRFDKMDQRLDGMDKRFDKMDQRLDGMDKRFDKMDQRLDTMDGRLTNLETDVSAVKEQQIENTQLLRSLEHRAEENSAQIMMISEDINYIKGDLEKLTRTQSEQEKVLERITYRSIQHEQAIATMRR